MGFELVHDSFLGLSSTFAHQQSCEIHGCYSIRATATAALQSAVSWTVRAALVTLEKIQADTEIMGISHKRKYELCRIFRVGPVLQNARNRNKTRRSGFKSHKHLVGLGAT